MSELTSELLQRRLGVSRSTLIRWHKAGILPGPQRVKGSGGRGWRKIWPSWVERQARQVLAWQKQGRSLEQIVALLKEDSVASVTEIVADFFDGSLPSTQVSPATRYADLVAQALADYPAPHVVVNAVRAAFMTRGVVTAIFAILSASENPVLIVSGGGAIKIMPDYLVSRQFGFGFGGAAAVGPTVSRGDPMILMALWPPLWEVFSEWQHPSNWVSQGPSTTNAPAIWRKEGDQVVEYAYGLFDGSSEAFGVPTVVARIIPQSRTVIGPFKLDRKS